MITDLSSDARSLADWQDSQKRAEADPEKTDISDLADALTRLLAWLSEADTTERMGMRTLILIYVVRPDFLQEQSLRLMSQTTKQNLSKLVVDFKQTFNLRPSVNQAAKALAVNGKV
jgi:hypothetical protein